MAFSRPQALRAVRGVARNLRDQGYRNIPFDKLEIFTVMNALKTTLDSNTYKRAQSNAIDAALTGHTLTNKHKKALHRACLQAMLDEDLI